MSKYSVLFFTSLFFFYGFGLNNMFNALGTDLSLTYHLSPTGLGWVSSMYFWANVLSLIPMGILCDRISPKKIILIALLVSILTVIFIAISHQLWILILSRLLMGMAGGCIFVGCMRIAVNWFPLSSMARAAGFIVTMGMFGGFMVQSPFIILIKSFGWREALLIAAGIGVLIFILILLGVKDQPKKYMNDLEKNLKIEGSVPVRSLGSLLDNLKLALGNSQNWFAGLAGSLNNLPIFLLGALWGVPYLTHVHGFTETESGLISGMLYFGTMLGSPLIGMISDKLEQRKWPMLVGIVFSIVLIELCVHISFDNLALWCVLFFLLGMTASAQVLAYPIVAESNPKNIISTATAIISMQMLLGGAISEPLFGYVLTYFSESRSLSGAYQAAIQILPIAFVFALGAACLIKESYFKNKIL